MRIFFVLCITFLLVACGGGGSSSDFEDTSIDFTTEELTNTVLLSKSLLDTGAMTEESLATIVFFSSDSMREITLAKEEDSFANFLEGNSDYTDQPWSVLSNGRLEITYPGNITCRTTKVAESSLEIDIRGECLSQNIVLEETVIRPLALDKSDFYGYSIALIDEGVFENWYFASDDSFEYSESYDSNNEDTNPIVTGSISNSIYENVVRVDFPDDMTPYSALDYGLFILIEGEFNNGQQLIFVTYDENDVLHNVRFIGGFDGNWTVDDYFINFGRFQF